MVALPTNKVTVKVMKVFAGSHALDPISKSENNMPIKICSIGDVMLGENLYHYKRGIVTKLDGRYKD